MNGGWRAVFGPMRFIETPSICYHVTPADNLESVCQRGILCSMDAGVNTSERPDAGHYIHVSETLEAAEKWIEILAEKQRGKQFAVLGVDLQGLTNVVYRDPFSDTGRIVNRWHIAPERIHELPGTAFEATSLVGGSDPDSRDAG